MGLTRDKLSQQGDRDLMRDRLSHQEDMDLTSTRLSQREDSDLTRNRLSQQEDWDLTRDGLSQEKRDQTRHGLSHEERTQNNDGISHIDRDLIRDRFIEPGDETHDQISNSKRFNTLYIIIHAVASYLYSVLTITLTVFPLLFMRNFFLYFL